jgi:5-oxopent-3-ene-1,2,5-tricarboxylate decarboxylase / 2-hydroxyhepta-2,4-diene-1,7-dioate isomerase
MSEQSFAPVDVSQNILDRFRKLPVATIWHHVMHDAGVALPFIEGLTLYTPDMPRLAARARTLRFLPPRPDLIAEVRDGEHSPEYRAMARCGPGDVLVCDLMGNTQACVFGDVKALQLKMNGACGIVTDGGMRDLDVMRDENYGLLVYARGRTPYASEPWAEPAEENVQIQCGGVLVRPGDVMVGDGDGVVVVPSWYAEECVAAVEEHEAVEAFVKAKIEHDNVPPGRYYPPSEEMYEAYRKGKGE